VESPVNGLAPVSTASNNLADALTERLGADYCDGCRDALDPSGTVVRTVALIPVVREPVDGPSWIYHPHCVPPEDGTWAPVFRGRLQGMPIRVSRSSATGRR
jgi:hypothetical protein